MDVHVNADVRRDDEGFEDIEEFWRATETVETEEPVKKVSKPRKSTRRASNASSVGEGYDTSDSISGSDDDDESRGASTRFSYDTTGTIDINDMSMTLNTTTGTIAPGTASMLKSTNKSGTVSVLKSSNKSANASSAAAAVTNSTVTNTSRRGSTGSRRVSFGSPIMDDNDNNDAQFSAGVGMDTNNTPFSTGVSQRMSSGASSSSSSKGKKSTNSSRRSSAASATSTPGTEFESTLLAGSASMISTPGSGDFPRGRVEADETYAEGESRLSGAADTDDESDSDNDDLANDSGFTTDDSLVASAMKRKMQQRKYRGDSGDEDSEEEEDDGRSRRSKRQTKGKTFQWWKNERVVYDRGEMAGFIEVEPTPKKAKRKLRKGGNKQEKMIFSPGGSLKSGASSSSAAAASEPAAVLEPVKLPKGVKFMEREKVDELSVYDETRDDIVSTPVICFHERLTAMELPPADSRPANKTHLNGLAAQSFNVKESPGFMSSWITGFVELGPRCIKDPECVGDCAQVFFVADCQDDAVEFGLANPKDENWNDKIAQRVLLKRRDSFYVPPGNVYRLENHSASKSATIYWTIVKALSTYQHSYDQEGKDK